MTKEQKQVKLIGIKVGNFRNIVATELTPDILGQRLIVVKGREGQGKTTELQGIQSAIAGPDALASKNGLKSGFISEAQLSDGDHKIFMGCRVRELAKGANAGETTFETFLYEKDENGKPKPVLIDGHKWSAKDYANEICTNLIFDVPSLFTKSQPEHRALIEKLFASELHKLGASAKVAEILEAKKQRDSCRALCDGKAAFMENFKEEGLSVDDLDGLVSVDIEALQADLTALEVDRGSLAAVAETKTDLNRQKAQNERDTALQAIKDKVVKVSASIRDLSESKMRLYRVDKKEWGDAKKLLDDAQVNTGVAFRSIESCTYLRPVIAEEIKIQLSAELERYVSSVKLGPEPIEPIVATFDESGIPSLDPENMPEDFVPFFNNRKKLLLDYSTLKAKPLEFETVSATDTKEFDDKISTLKSKIALARQNNSIYDRYAMWQDWIDAKNAYESRLDELRSMYAGIDTGVEGLKIVPIEESGSVKIWMSYDGSYDPAFFGNAEKELRRMWDYSGAQQGIIGVLLQSARLNLKEKALRLVVLSACPMTKMGLDVLASVCEKENIQLITDQTADDYDLDNLDENVVAVEGGEIFFRSQKA